MLLVFTSALRRKKHTRQHLRRGGRRPGVGHYLLIALNGPGWCPGVIGCVHAEFDLLFWLPDDQGSDHGMTHGASSMSVSARLSECCAELYLSALHACSILLFATHPVERLTSLQRRSAVSLRQCRGVSIPWHRLALWSHIGAFRRDRPTWQRHARNAGCGGCLQYVNGSATFLTSSASIYFLATCT